MKIDPKLSPAELGNIIARAERLRPYTTHWAGLFWGVKTVDAGRIRRRIYFRVLEWGNTNQAFWFIRDTYQNYATLPQSEDIEWVPQAEYHKRKMAVYDAGRLK